MDNGSSGLVLVIAVWAACGLIGVLINAAKGKSKAWGFFGGSLFGIFGWIFLAVHGGGKTYKCVACRESVREGAVVCRHCGAHFTVPAGTAG